MGGWMFTEEQVINNRVKADQGDYDGLFGWQSLDDFKPVDAWVTDGGDAILYDLTLILKDDGTEIISRARVVGKEGIRQTAHIRSRSNRIECSKFRAALNDKLGVHNRTALTRSALDYYRERGIDI